MLKEQIKTCFDNAANTYDSVAEIQRKSAKVLMDFLDDRKISSIIDIGCGTVNVSLELYKKYPDAEYTFCDISENMLRIAAEKFPKASKQICCDAENYEFDRSYDLAISNLSMQWFSEAEKFIERIKTHCKLFAFSTLLNTSFESYKKLFKFPPTFKYPTLDEILKITPQQYAIKRYAIELDNFFGVARYFKKLGACLKSHNNPSKLASKNSPIILEYDIFFAVV